jgi:hypothetical protein
MRNLRVWSDTTDVCIFQCFNTPVTYILEIKPCSCISIFFFFLDCYILDLNENTVVTVSAAPSQWSTSPLHFSSFLLTFHDPLHAFPLYSPYTVFSYFVIFLPALISFWPIAFFLHHLPTFMFPLSGCSLLTRSHLYVWKAFLLKSSLLTPQACVFSYSPESVNLCLHVWVLAMWCVGCSRCQRYTNDQNGHERKNHVKHLVLVCLCFGWVYIFILFIQFYF